MLLILIYVRVIYVVICLFASERWHDLNIRYTRKREICMVQYVKKYLKVGCIRMIWAVQWFLMLVRRWTMKNTFASLSYIKKSKIQGKHWFCNALYRPFWSNLFFYFPEYEYGILSYWYQISCFFYLSQWDLIEHGLNYEQRVVQYF